MTGPITMYYLTNMVVGFQMQKKYACFLLIYNHLKVINITLFFCFDYHDSRGFFSITSLTERSEALFKELLIFHCDNLELIRRSRFIIQS